MRANRILLATLAAVAALAPLAAAQALPFTIRAEQGGQSQIIADGSTLAFQAAGVGLPVDGSISLTYTGTGGSATIHQLQLTGSTDFAITSAPDPNATVLAGTEGCGVRIRYTPTSSRAAAAKIAVWYTANGVTNGFTVNLAGTSPEFAYTYVLQPDGNGSQVNPGETIPAPATTIGETSSVLITLTNRGSGAGSVDSMALGGSARFTLAGLPLLPALVDAGKDLKFSIHFKPDERDLLSAMLRMVVCGRSLSFKVAGSGQGAWFQYEVLGTTLASAVAGGVIVLPEATVGAEKSSVAVRVWNKGNFEGRVATLSVSGAAFSLLETPFLPYPLAPGASFTFRIQFNPALAGKSVGRLRVGLDDFTLEADGTGPNFTYAYAAANAMTPVAAGGTVLLPSVAAGTVSGVTFVIRNEGSAPQVVSSISVSGASFKFPVRPALPLTIEAGATAQFSIAFEPAELGVTSGSLRVNNESFVLSGAANQPPALPSFAFSGVSGTVDPAQQPAIGLRLASEYALPVSGTLTLVFTPDAFANDPAVQFSSGGRTVAFTIPGGSRDAVFANGASQVRIQTGTVAGNISIIPSFATAQGSFDLTPSSPATLNLAVVQTAPRLVSASVSSKTTSGLTLLITGYATGRAITQMDFQFTAVSGENLGTSKVTIPVEPTFNAWFQSTASAAYGSQFSATVPFTLAGEIKDGSKVSSLMDAIHSVSVTLTNRQGVSTAGTVNLK